MKCLICEREFRIKGTVKKRVPRRPGHAKTCSKKCSKIFTRIRMHFNDEYRSKLNKQEKEFRKMIEEIHARETYCFKCKIGFDEDSDECFRCNSKDIEHRELDISRETILKRIKGEEK